MWQPSGKSGQAGRPRAYHQFLDKEHPEDYRREEVKTLARAFQARENRLVLGLPGMGVSNLLRFLVTRERSFERPVTFSYLDCDILGGCPNYEAFFEEIARQLHEQGLGDQPQEQVLGYERLKRLLERIEDDPLSRVVIVVDQTDGMLRAADEDFYRKLKALTDLNKRVCYIFAASPFIADRVDPDNLLFAGRRLAVGRLNERDCASAIMEEAQRLGVKYDPASQARLARLTGGHPGLLRAVTSAVEEEGLDSSDTETIWVERLLAREDVQHRCLKIRKELDSAQQAGLRSIAEGQSDIVEGNTMSCLQGLGLVDEHQGTYRLFSPLFQRIIATQEIKSEPVAPTTPSETGTRGTPMEPVRIEGPTIIPWNGQKITVAGKVFKGDQEVRISPLELRLIACLQRPERKVFSKEDIAKYVYYDEAEEEKEIRDGRVEDLVRRVRKRLGKVYIKTHWGQGYEFLG